MQASSSLMKAAVAMLAAAAASCGVHAAEPVEELRVCADPDNLPFSNRALEGFENRIAEIVAHDLGAVVRYTWHPQRRGFVRQTLKAGACDLVIGVPSGYDLLDTTSPYYTSTYVFVSKRDAKASVKSFDDPGLREMRIGLHAFGDDGANSPAAHALARRGIVGKVTGYTILDTADSPAGNIVTAVADGDIDVAIVWGPFAGYFVQQQRAVLAMEPVASTTAEKRAPLPFVYDISMGVRRGDAVFKQKIEGILKTQHAQIRQVLLEFGVPLVSTSTSTSPATTARPQSSASAE